MRPRGAVEALDDTAQRGGGPVPYGGALHTGTRPVAVRQQLTQRLCGVVRAGGVLAGQRDPAIADGQRIALGRQPVGTLGTQPLEGRRCARPVHVDGQLLAARRLRGPYDPVGARRLQRLLDEVQRRSVGLRARHDGDGRGDGDPVVPGAHGLRGGGERRRSGSVPGAALAGGCRAAGWPGHARQGDHGEGDGERGGRRGARTVHPSVLPRCSEVHGRLRCGEAWRRVRTRALRMRGARVHCDALYRVRCPGRRIRRAVRKQAPPCGGAGAMDFSTGWMDVEATGRG